MAMRNTLTASAALLALFPLAVLAQTDVVEVIRGSVVITRTGDREPAVFQDSKALSLTSLGAAQAAAAGNFIRERYLPTNNGTTASSGEIGLYGLSTNVMDINQLFILAGGSQYMAASAEAFMQALYPPYIIQNGSAIMPYPTFELATNPPTILQNPLNGYQFPWIETASPSEGTSIVIDGSESCQNWYDFNSNYPSSKPYLTTLDQSNGLYATVANVVADENLPIEQFTYQSAYLVYDYLSYQQTHNFSVAQQLNASDLVDINAMPRLRYLADQFNFALYSNAADDPDAYNAPIATVAGATLAGGIIDRLSSNINSKGLETKLSLLFTEFEPFMSFFTLSGLTTESMDFWGLPEFGSSMIFELYSLEDANNQTAWADYPSTDDLHVRFMFRNGTNAPTKITPLFGIADSSEGMTWNDFATSMAEIMIDDYATWCSICDSWLLSPWCLYYNSTVINDILDGDGSGSSYSITPKIAGLIGAIATLAFVGLVLILAIAVGGLRFKRATPKPKSSLGGFKGSQKLASDADLTHDRKSVAGASVVEEPQGKERVGSWELKNSQNVQRPVNLRRPSMDEDDDRFNPFNEPVRPTESV